MESQIELLRRDITIRLGSMIIVATGILLAAKFLGRARGFVGRCLTRAAGDPT